MIVVVVLRCGKEWWLKIFIFFAVGEWDRAEGQLKVREGFYST